MSEKNYKKENDDFGRKRKVSDKKGGAFYGNVS